MNYKLKYSGTQIDALLDKIDHIDLSVYARTDQDVTFNGKIMVNHIEPVAGLFYLGRSGNDIAVMGDMYPMESNYRNLGSIRKPWLNFHFNGKLNPNENGFGYVLPDTTGLQSDKTILTRDDVDLVASKEIHLELLAAGTTIEGGCINGEDDFTPCRKLRVHLKNFNDSDVNSYLFLYRRSRNCRPGRPVKQMHPVDYSEDEKTAYSFRYMGYGVIANAKIPDQDRYRPGVPEWMPHQGKLKTKWQLNATDIQRGYKDIDIGKEFVSLFMMPDDSNYVQEHDYDWTYDDELTLIGSKQIISIGQVKSNQLDTMSAEAVSIEMSHQSQPTVGSLFGIVDGVYYLNHSYMNLKLRF